MPAPSQQWFGLTKDGGKVTFDHATLMDWAEERDLTISIGWGATFHLPSGTRIVRGMNPVAARAAGWEDIAEMMEDVLVNA